MHFFNQLKINGLLIEVNGYFQSKMNVLEIHCKEALAMFKNWKYEELVVHDITLIDNSETIYSTNSTLVISEISHNKIQFLHI